MAFSYPRCETCNALIEGELDDDSHANYDGCPNTCQECGQHLEADSSCPNGCEEDRCVECGRVAAECTCD
jgi:hypothetical protein